MNILSAQSAVCLGHVGNSSAVFALQRLGAEVWPVNTVQFSNHPGHGAWAGEVTRPGLVRALLGGIEARGAFAVCDAVLSGYLGDAETGRAVLETVRRVRAANPEALYCCDPVIGDADTGVYVRPAVAGLLRDVAVAEADVLTPNLFELGWLTGLSDVAGSRSRTADALVQLRHRMRPGGRRIVLLTSVPDGAARLGVVAAWPEGVCAVWAPVLPIDAHGAGDALAALFLGHLLRGAAIAEAASAALSAVHAVLARSAASGARELRLIEAQDALVEPPARFAAEPWVGE